MCVIKKKKRWVVLRTVSKEPVTNLEPGLGDCRSRSLTIGQRALPLKESLRLLLPHS